MKLRALLASVGAALALVLATPASALYVMSVDAPLTGAQGTTATVNVHLSIDDFDSVDAVSFSLGYNTSFLSYTGAMAGPLTTGWDFAEGEAPPGQVNISMLDSTFLLGLFGPVSGNVAVLTFDLIGAGSSDLALSDVLLDNFLTFPIGFGADTVTDASIDVTASNAVPLPHTLLLVGLGLMLLGWSRSRAAAGRT
jgi:hypothetical protein